MSKYKVGDKVKVRENLRVYEEYGDLIFEEEMEEFRGKEVNISKVDNSDDTYKIENYNGYWWSDEMFEDVIEFPEGSIVTDSARYRKVLGACGDIRFLSYCITKYDPNHFNLDDYSMTLSVQGLKKNNYEPYTPNAPKPKFTHKQLEEKLGFEFELEEENE